MLRRLVVALCAIVAVGALSAEAHRLRHRGGGDNLVVISEQDVDLSLDRYTIDVSTAKGAYKGIRVKNNSGYLFDLSSVQIVYSDGSTHNEDRQIDMYQGVDLTEGDGTVLTQPIRPDVQVLHDFTNDASVLDATQRLRFDDKGQVVFNFGKYTGQSVKEVITRDPNYYQWMMTKDFSVQVKRILQDIHSGNEPRQSA